MLRYSTALRRIVSLPLPLGLAALAAGCSDGPAVLAARTPLDASGSLTEGALYVADLHPLNPRIQQLPPNAQHGVVEGKAYFRVVNGELQAVVDVSGATPAGAFPNGLHPQHIHAATACPTMAEDANGDGIVDVIEGLPKYGPIMIPLDGDLADTSSQVATFPVGEGARGSYHYTASASVSALEAALGHALALPSRHVVVHGVDLATALPGTVQTLPGIPAQLTLPVACGELREMP
jgi:hypothetical protein